MFKSFGKVPRLLNMPMVVTEKIDGSNAQICIEYQKLLNPEEEKYVIGVSGDLCLLAGSRSKWVFPGEDNFGFAAWVTQNVSDLFTLGHGRHFGEWWGQGIQRGYGLKEKRFSLFNTGKWSSERPACTSVVPVLYYGQFNQQKIEEVKAELKVTGSRAVPFMNPEGVIIYLPKANMLFKSTFDNDDLPKGLTVEVKDATG